MPRGEHPNSKANLKKFNEKTAREAQKKSAESHKLNSSLKAAMKKALTDEELMKACNAILKRAQAGNIQAFREIRETIGEGQSEETGAQVNLAILADVLPREEPPDE